MILPALRGEMTKGGYFHPLFLRGQPTLCKRMKRRDPTLRAVLSDSPYAATPDFYKMPYSHENLPQKVTQPKPCIKPFNFPLVLHMMLQECSADVASWDHSGTCFFVWQDKLFSSTCLLKYVQHHIQLFFHLLSHLRILSDSFQAIAFRHLKENWGHTVFIAYQLEKRKEVGTTNFFAAINYTFAVRLVHCQWNISKLMQYIRMYVAQAQC